LDDQKASQGAEVVENSSSSEAFHGGVQEARQHYVDMGGKAEDLPDGDDLTTSAVALLRMMEGQSDNSQNGGGQ